MVIKIINFIFLKTYFVIIIKKALRDQPVIYCRKENVEVKKDNEKQKKKLHKWARLGKVFSRQNHRMQKHLSFKHLVPKCYPMVPRLVKSYIVLQKDLE